MKRLVHLALLLGFFLSTQAQNPLDLDSCRALAVSNNKSLLISEEKINAAHQERKAAFTSYLPHVSATGAYLRIQKEISLLSNDQKDLLNNIGTTVSDQFRNTAQQLVTAYPEYAPLLQSLGGLDIATPLNSVGESLTDALRTDTRNVFAGMVTVTQPLYMGGKIRAYNKITHYAEEIARQMQQTALQEVILQTDEAYWMVVSLTHKKRVAESYLQLLLQLENDIDRMIEEGVATKADGLSVKVKVNEAELSLTKVEDGLTLSRMVLCQLCGFDLHTPLDLVDENIQEVSLQPVDPAFTMEQVYQSRPELRSLELATRINRQKVNVVRSEHLPTVALMGGYMVSNPSLFNGYQKDFKGTWNVGVMVSVPIWSWGEGTFKTRAAKAQVRIAQYELSDAREKIELQVNQAAFQVKEALKKWIMAGKNLEKAEENLRYATLGFEEGVIPPSNVLEAHTAWLSAQSEKIDAQIDIRLSQVYLEKSMGTLR